ncbi:single-stranded DNA-binding protein [Jeotgalibacillus marinus]|uniref:Single-stranded DNA-binding protein n=1 Tax=Jeotgalibacillus marinus TaxID=86667 RepID=A0ABV3Q0F5_9BACL
MINQVTLVGRLTKDPELRAIGNGKHVLSVIVAVTRPFKNQNGEKDADFVRCTMWNRNAENTSEYCAKGSLVGITGRLQTRNFDREDGNRHFMTEVVAESVRFLEPKRLAFTPVKNSVELPAKEEHLHVETIR